MVFVALFVPCSNSQRGVLPPSAPVYLEGVLVEEGVEKGEQEVLDLQGLLGHPVR